MFGSASKQAVKRAIKKKKKIMLGGRGGGWGGSHSHKATEEKAGAPKRILTWTTFKPPSALLFRKYRFALTASGFMT